ncbi:hypothetical protein D3C81_1628240 [compost metagenome]
MGMNRASGKLSMGDRCSSMAMPPKNTHSERKALAAPIVRLSCRADTSDVSRLFSSPPWCLSKKAMG